MFNVTNSGIKLCSKIKLKYQIVVTICSKRNCISRAMKKPLSMVYLFLFYVQLVPFRMSLYDVIYEEENTLININKLTFLQLNIFV
jgi:hypothetical protein